MTEAETKVVQLEKEVELLRSFVIGLAGRDSEGNYQPSFVKRILGSLSEKPRYHFKDASSFLNHLREER